MRRKANSQYITLKIIDPTLIAPMLVAPPTWPMMATSHSPNSGTVMFDTMLGSASRNMSRFSPFISDHKVTK